MNGMEWIELNGSACLGERKWVVYWMAFHPFFSGTWANGMYLGYNQRPVLNTRMVGTFQVELYSTWSYRLYIPYISLTTSDYLKSHIFIESDWSIWSKIVQSLRRWWWSPLRLLWRVGMMDWHHQRRLWRTVSVCDSRHGCGVTVAYGHGHGHGHGYRLVRVDFVTRTICASGDDQLLQTITILWFKVCQSTLPVLIVIHWVSYLPMTLENQIWAQSKLDI